MFLQKNASNQVHRPRNEPGHDALEDDHEDGGSSALLLPNGATAAMHGVYSRQNTMKVNAASGVMAERTAAVPPYTTAIMDTTLSFARKPEIKQLPSASFRSPAG